MTNGLEQFTVGAFHNCKILELGEPSPAIPAGTWVRHDPCGSIVYRYDVPSGTERWDVPLTHIVKAAEGHLQSCTR
jgi:hypothetical protein